MLQTLFQVQDFGDFTYYPSNLDDNCRGGGGSAEDDDDVKPDDFFDDADDDNDYRYCTSKCLFSSLVQSTLGFTTRPRHRRRVAKPKWGLGLTTKWSLNPVQTVLRWI